MLEEPRRCGLKSRTLTNEQLCASQVERHSYMLLSCFDFMLCFFRLLTYVCMCIYIYI